MAPIGTTPSAPSPGWRRQYPSPRTDQATRFANHSLHEFSQGLRKTSVDAIRHGSPRVIKQTQCRLKRLICSIYCDKRDVSNCYRCRSLLSEQPQLNHCAGANVADFARASSCARTIPFSWRSSSARFGRANSRRPAQRKEKRPMRFKCPVHLDLHPAEDPQFCILKDRLNQPKVAIVPKWDYAVANASYCCVHPSSILGTAP